jgi:hypothetical protein
MAIPTDRGFVVITDEDDGSKTVQIAVNRTEDGLENVFAEHVRTATVKIDGDLSFEESAVGQHSTEPVQVFVDDTGVVHVAGL